MRIGTENKRRLRWAIVLTTTTVLLTIYNIVRSVKPAPSTPSAAAISVAAPKKSHSPVTGRETRLDLDALRFSDQETSGIGRRNIFVVQNIRTKSNSNDTNPSTGTIGPPPPEMQSSPQIPFTFYGFADRSPESRRIFLQDSEQIFVTKLGDTIERRYKVVAVSTNSVTIEDLLQNHQQLIPLVER